MKRTEAVQPHLLKHTPVAMLVFNRPGKTRRVFEAVARARPPVMLVVADGPRASHPDDVRLCRETRAVFDAIDWPCKLLTNYSDVNLGCKNRILSGLDWVFSEVPEAIVLEDDCLAQPSFFPYCEEMLERYRDDPRVHMVRGGNFFGGRRIGRTSYHFSRWYHIWGWATWARAWRCTDRAMSRWPELRDARWLERGFPLKIMADLVGDNYERAYQSKVDTWEYHFGFGGMANGALTICPMENLVTNIGFGPDAAHYIQANHPHSEIPSAPIRFPLRHPRSVSVFEKADLLEWQLAYPQLVKRPLWRRALGRVRRKIRSAIRRE